MAVRLTSATVTSSTTCWSMKSATKSECTAGSSPCPQTMKLVSSMRGGGVRVRFETMLERTAAPPRLASRRSSNGFALIMIVRGPRTTTPAISGLPIETRRTGDARWIMRDLPACTQIGSPGPSGPFFAARAASRCFWNASRTAAPCPFMRLVSMRSTISLPDSFRWLPHAATSTAAANTASILPFRHQPITSSSMSLRAGA